MFKLKHELLLTLTGNHFVCFHAPTAADRHQFPHHLDISDSKSVTADQL